MTTYPAHPIAALFPMFTDAELQTLADDIREHGLREPICLFENKILDGRNRFAACKLAKVEPRFRSYRGKDPLAYVISLNLRRRHLDESQRSMVAARIATLPNGVRTDRQGASIDAPTRSQPEAAALLNVSRPSVQRARVVLERAAPELVAAVDAGRVPVSVASQLATAPAAVQRAAASDPVEAKRLAKKASLIADDQRRDDRLARLAQKQIAATVESKRYSVIYADPPWRYEHAPEGDEGRSIEANYPTMMLDEICTLRPWDRPMISVADDNCVLFLWATSPKLREAMSVLEAWGFTYKTCMVWVKDKIGMGYYARQRHELLLIGTRGSVPTPKPSDRPDSVIEAARGAHSTKPEVFRRLIDRMIPRVARLEIFCREVGDGWDAWGFESAT